MRSSCSPDGTRGIAVLARRGVDRLHPSRTAGRDPGGLGLSSARAPSCRCPSATRFSGASSIRWASLLTEASGRPLPSGRPWRSLRPPSSTARPSPSRCSRASPRLTRCSRSAAGSESSSSVTAASGKIVDRHRHHHPAAVNRSRLRVRRHRADDLRRSRHAIDAIHTLGCKERSICVVGAGDAAPGLQWLAPYAACPWPSTSPSAAVTRCWCWTT